MKLWKVLLPLLVLGCSLWCSCPVLAAESPAETLAEESGSAELTEQLDWDIQSVLEQLGLSFTDVSGAGESFTLSRIWQVFSAYLSGRISRPFAMLGGLLTVIYFRRYCRAYGTTPGTAAPDRSMSLSVHWRR
ncbi:MAG: hypothetical protein ACLSFT_00700 [Ruminococcus callidus]